VVVTFLDPVDLLEPEVLVELQCLRIVRRHHADHLLAAGLIEHVVGRGLMYPDPERAR